MQNRATVERTIENLHGRLARLEARLARPASTATMHDLMHKMTETRAAIAALRWVLDDADRDSLCVAYAPMQGV